MACVALALAIAPAVSARDGWPDTPLARTQALAELQTLNAELLSHPSATLTLEGWCGAHHLAVQAKVVAHRVQNEDKPLPPDGRALLGIGPHEPVRYRRVQLTCGGTVLSDADNWYVPSRLTAAMNRQLDTTDLPFGKVVQPLHFRRQTISAELLWSPLPQGWDSGMALPPASDKPLAILLWSPLPQGWDSGMALPPASDKPLAIPPHVLQHRALLYTQGNQPFSLVVERYTASVLVRP